MHKKDEQLVRDYLKGDEKSLEVLIQRYLKPIYGFAYRHTGSVQEAEDIAQEVFVKIWRNLKKFDQEKKFKTWIFTIAKNAIIDFLKKKKAIPFSDSEDLNLDMITDSFPLPDEISEQEEKREILTRAIKKLSPKYRAILSFSHNNHFTFREIAESLGEPLNTVKSRYRRGLVILKKILPK